MRKTRLLALVCVPAIALAACGSRSAAPVVYGSQPTWQGRVYNNPSQSTARYGASQTASTTTYRGASVSSRARSGNQYYAGSRPQPSVLTPVEVQTLSQLDSAPRATASNAYYTPGVADDEALNRATAGVVRVRQGDTVYAIARRTGVSPSGIIALNGLRSPYALSIGQLVRIPRGDAAIGGASGVGGGNAQPSRILASQPAPVSSVQGGQGYSNGLYVVSRGDNLYRISRSTGVSVSEIASANNLRRPYSLSIGDRLVIPSQSRPILASARPVTSDAVSFATIMNEGSSSGGIQKFSWPLKGALVRRFETGVGGARNDGINIAAPVGTPVRAAADGEVVYRGSDLDGYGNLILIRHDGDYVTAYAHNDVMLVKKGQRVRQGQIISKVGKSGSAGQPQLHFEIRRDLKAVDPLQYLQS
ncbi:MAG: M23 family metallopeptidase [Pseudomonadota bacterium]